MIGTEHWRGGRALKVLFCRQNSLGRSHPQGLEVGPRKGPYLLVFVNRRTRDRLYRFAQRTKTTIPTRRDLDKLVKSLPAVWTVPTGRQCTAFAGNGQNRAETVGANNFSSSTLKIWRETICRELQVLGVFR